jgi:hypothetical protein
VCVFFLMTQCQFDLRFLYLNPLIRDFWNILFATDTKCRSVNSFSQLCIEGRCLNSRYRSVPPYVANKKCSSAPDTKNYFQSVESTHLVQCSSERIFDVIKMKNF